MNLNLTSMTFTIGFALSRSFDHVVDRVHSIGGSGDCIKGGKQVCHIQKSGRAIGSEANIAIRVALTFEYKQPDRIMEK